MAAAQHGTDEAIVGINVTPLVDITLVLLIIFMVTASYIVRESIDVDLPRAATAGDNTGTTLTFVLDKQSQLFLDGAPVSRAVARSAVRAAVAKSPDTRALIGADRSVTHGEVVGLIDLVKGEGLTRFAIQIQRESTTAEQR